MFLMVECVREELQAMKDGLNDVIPAELLSGLTAEVSLCTMHTKSLKPSPTYLKDTFLRVQN